MLCCYIIVVVLLSKINPNWSRDFNASAITSFLDKMSDLPPSSSGSSSSDSRFDASEMDERINEANRAAGKGEVVPSNLDFDDDMFLDDDEESEYYDEVRKTDCRFSITIIFFSTQL